MYHHTQLQPSFSYLPSVSRPEPHSYLMTAPLPPDVPGPVPEADYQGSHSGKPAAVMPLPSGSLLSCSWVPILLLTSLNSRLDMGTPADEHTVASIACNRHGHPLQTSAPWPLQLAAEGDRVSRKFQRDQKLP